MTLNVLLIALIAILVPLFVFFLYLFLKKDKELIELKAKFEHLLKAESEQYKVSKQRDDYVAMMVHELRSPLSVIKGSADLVIKEEKALDADQKYTMLSQIKQSSIDLLAIVNDILDVSKLESGRFELHKTMGSINKLLQNETVYYTTLALEKDIKVETNFDEGIPEFEFDDDRIKHVMNNLMSNALKFMEKGGSLKISSKLQNDGNAEILVADTGSGVPDNMKNKLFNKFVQMENRQHSDQKGTGLGLYIAKGIVEAHGGAIWVEDNDPQGAVFVFTIPTSI